MEFLLFTVVAVGLFFLSDWLLRVASRRLFPWFGTQKG